MGTDLIIYAYNRADSEFPAGEFTSLACVLSLDASPVEHANDRSTELVQQYMVFFCVNVEYLRVVVDHCIGATLANINVMCRT